MDEFEIDDSLDTSFSDDSSLDSVESSGDAVDAMDSVEVPTIEEDSFDSIESGNIEDYSYEDTESFSDEVSDVMNGVETEELTFDDEPIADIPSVEVLESENDQPIEEPIPDLIGTMDDVETEVLEFDDQVEESYEATPNSEIEILQEDGTIDTLENIQVQLEESEAVEQMEEPYEATPISEIEILQEDGTIDTLENIQAQLEAEPEAVEQMEEPYEATPISEIEILQEDGTVDTLENIQEQGDGEQDDFVESAEIVESSLQSEEIQEQLDSHEALSNMREYMNAHNYEMEDYETYSKDPEWQALNRDLQIANGIETIEKPESMTIDSELQEISDEVKDTDETSEIGNWLKEINPNFDPFDWESPYNNNCGSCTYAVYRRLEGDTEIVATAENIGYNSEMEALTGMEQVSMSPEEIANRLLEQGDGAHAIIGVDRAEGPGHWFNAACIDGKVVAIDGQSGEILDWPPDYGDVVNWEMSVKKEVAEVHNSPSYFSKI